MGTMGATDMLRELRRQTTDQIAKTIYAMYPVGTRITWDHNGHLQGGIVIHHGYQGSLKVKNECTRREVWLNEYRVAEESMQASAPSAA